MVDGLNGDHIGRCLLQELPVGLLQLSLTFLYFFIKCLLKCFVLFFFG